MIRKRGKTYTVQVEWRTTDSAGHQHRHQKTKGGFKTKAEAKIYENKLELLKANGKLSNANPLFTDYFRDWCNTYRIPGKTANTARRYKYCENTVSKYFTGVKIKSITRASFQRFLNSYGKDHAKATVIKTTRVIISSIKDAVADNIISSDPTWRTQLVYDDSRTQKVEYLSIADMKRLTKAIKAKLNPKQTSRYIILTALYTGMRIGEILGLAWSDIDFEHGTISINHSWDYVHNHLKDPKNASSKRVITASPALLDILQQLRDNDFKFVFIQHRIPSYVKDDDERLKLGVPKTTTVNYVLKLTLEKLGLPMSLHVHSLRHVHVAYLYANGVDWYSISRRLGHSSVKTTMDIYAYLIQEKAAKSDKLIDKLIDDL